MRIPITRALLMEQLPRSSRRPASEQIPSTPTIARRCKPPTAPASERIPSCNGAPFDEIERCRTGWRFRTISFGIEPVEPCATQQPIGVGRALAAIVGACE